MLEPLHRAAHDLRAGYPQVDVAKQREAKMEATVSFITIPQSDTPSLPPHSISHTDQPWYEVERSYTAV